MELEEVADRGRNDDQRGGPGRDDDDKKPGHGHVVTIVVNTREHEWRREEISFEQVLALAFNPVPSGPIWEFTVGYRRGPGNRPQGSLTPGRSVKVKDGMVFNATATDKS